MITFNDQRQTTNDLPPGLRSSAYSWPIEPFRPDTWTEEAAGLSRTLPERLEDVAVDSRWPAFFPSPISIVTTADGAETEDRDGEGSQENRGAVCGELEDELMPLAQPEIRIVPAAAIHHPFLSFAIGATGDFHSRHIRRRTH